MSWYPEKDADTLRCGLRRQTAGDIAEYHDLCTLYQISPAMSGRYNRFMQYVRGCERVEDTYLYDNFGPCQHTDPYQEERHETR